MHSYFTDHLGNTIQVSFPLKKIVSLVPSQTELLFDLGLNQAVVGITKFCIHPKEEVKHIRKIGGTKTINIEAIKEIEPDIIIANKEENTQSQIELLQKYFPVWVSDIVNLNDAIKMIESLGDITHTMENAKKINAQIISGFENLQPHKNRRHKVAYLIWSKPYMSINADTFIHDMLVRCGFDNVFASQTNRYPEVSIEMLQFYKPDYIFLSSEPYPFSTKHIDELLSKNIVSHKNQIRLVDGEMFSWYGSRLIQSVKYFNSFISGL